MPPIQADLHGTQQAPTIETERLRLRGHRLSDFPQCLALWSDPEVTRFIGGKPFTREEVWARLLRYRGHWNLLGFGYWVIEEKATEAFVGEVGLSESKREMEPSIEGIPEAGWVLAPAHFGKGYATEAVAAVIEWSRAHLGALPLACIIAPDNAASLRVAKKCGFEERCQAKYRGTTVVQFMLDPGGNSEARSAEV